MPKKKSCEDQVLGGRQITQARLRARREKEEAFLADAKLGKRKRD